MIRKYTATITRTNEYEIEIDDSVYTDDYLRNWEKSFYDTPDIDTFVEHLAGALTQHEHDHRSAMEGFGVVKCFYSNGEPAYQGPEHVDGIMVTILSEDSSDMDIEVVETKIQY